MPSQEHKGDPADTQKPDLATPVGASFTDEDFQKACEHGEMEKELEKVQEHREHLDPKEQNYLQRTRDADIEIARLRSTLDKLNDYLSASKQKSDSRETTKERDARLQQRANELFAQDKKKKQVCHQISEEERRAGRASISPERLQRILRKP